MSLVGSARCVRPNRHQLEWRVVDLDRLLPADHRARVVWGFVEGMDLSAFYTQVGSRAGGAGRPAADPAVLLALWLYATLEGVGSARRVARLCESDVAYQWLCGGVRVNYHGLSDFRGGHGELLDGLLSEQIAAFLASGMVSMEEVAVDGTKVRASAGSGSYRSDGGLSRYERAARDRIAALKSELARDPGAESRRVRAARARAERELEEKVAAARKQLAALRSEKEARSRKHKKAEGKKRVPKVSTTDVQARRMQFADGGVRAGYNLQLAVSTDSHVIVGVQETDRRNDAGLASSMVAQLEGRYGALPARLLADTRYATHKDVLVLDGKGIEVYMPPSAVKPTAKAESVRSRERRRAKEPAALKAWRARMASDAGQVVYRRRSRVETVNGIVKRRGLGQLVVRGLAKVRSVVLLHALAHNLWRGHRLACAAG